MRAITFQGNDYVVPDDAKWITKDFEGVYVWKDKPEIFNTEDGAYFRWQRTRQKISDDCLEPICEEIK